MSEALPLPPSHELEADVAIVGDGPAAWVGAIAAAARGAGVVVVSRGSPPGARVGEHLAGEVRAVLIEGGVDPELVLSGATPCASFEAIGASGRAVRPGILDPWGGGWIVDRASMTTALRDAALARGVRVTGCRPGLRSRLVVDATGSGAAIARRHGARRITADRLRATVWRPVPRASGPRGAATCVVACDPNGWWYAAASPGGTAAVLRVSDRTEERPPAPREIAGPLARCVPCGARSVPVAVTRPAAGMGWIAIGDAALALDPLCGRGLAWACTTAVSGALAACAWLRGDGGALDAYGAAVEELWARHLAQRRRVYARVARSEGPWWNRGSAGLPRDEQEDRGPDLERLAGR